MSNDCRLIEVSVQGNSFNIPVPEGASVADIKDIYQETVGKSLDGMKLYNQDLQEISDDDDAPGSVTAVRDKHQSNSEDCRHIKVSVQGSTFDIPVPEGASVAEVKEIYQGTVGKSLEGMKLYDQNLSEISDDDDAPEEVTAVRDKHQSNG